MDRNHPNIILLHGALGTSKELQPVAEYLKDHGHKSATFNFSGHGKDSQMPPEFRIDYFARDLEKYLKLHGLKDVVIFGHSMGGYVGLYHKVNFEDSPIRAVFTYGTKFNWSEKSVKKELPMLDSDHLHEKFPHYVEILKEKHGDNWKQLLKSTTHMMQHLERLDGLTKEDLHDLEIPVYLLLGDQDRMVTTEETHLAESWIPHSLVKTISHSKHEMERANIKEIALTIIENLT
jgi:esterase/lipase